jgi:riboflavin kinase/FMN adenylyltransferase
MPLENDLAKLSPDGDTALAVGVFDGVHRGHQALLARLTKRARARRLISGVVTFDPHPQLVLSPKTSLAFLADLNDRVALLKNTGVSLVFVLPFTREVASLSARDFTGLLAKHLRMRELVVGTDFTLGRGKGGNVAALKALGEEMGFDVTEVPPVAVSGDIASSTAVRQSLASGDLAKAGRLLGRPFSLHGRVVHGVGRGTEIGFPTANLAPDPSQALPATGVYATWAYTDGQAYQSMTYVGRRPTFGDPGMTVEVYLIGYQGDLYDKDLKIAIIERLRGDRKFASAEELKRQMARDIEQGKLILGSGDRK